MRKKILACLALGLAVCAVVVFCGKDNFVKNYAAGALSKGLGLTCSIAQARLHVNSLELSGVELGTPGARLSVGQGRIEWKYAFPVSVRGVRITLTDPFLNVDDSSVFQKKIASLVSPSKSPAPALPMQDIGFSINHAALDLKNGDSLHVRGAFTISGGITRGVFHLDDASVSSFDLESSSIRISGLRVNKSASDAYTVHIPAFTIKNKDFTDLDILVKLEPGKVIAVAGRHALFGLDAALTLTLDYADPDNICIQAEERRLSFENFVSLLNDKGDIEFHGLFDGVISMCGNAAAVRSVGGRLLNGAGGIIRVKNESALEFLRPYLDSRSYKALVDNFKNYSYNNGDISLSKDGDSLGVTMYFVSPDMGTRNIGIVFHEVAEKKGEER